MHIFHTDHCVKSVQIRRYLWSVFSCTRTEYGDSRSKLDILNEEKVWLLGVSLEDRLDLIFT